MNSEWSPLPPTVGSLWMLHETELESWSPAKYQANITYSMLCIFLRSEPVVVFFLYRKMRKKVWHFSMQRKMQSGFLADHKMSCWLCILCAIKTLPLFSDNTASTLSCGVSVMRVFRRHAEQKAHAWSFSLSSAFCGFVRWDGAPEVKPWWLGLCPWCWLTIQNVWLNSRPS